jgi:hypothetical protein
MQKVDLNFLPNQMEVRALSFKEPYASLMLHGKIETRGRNTNYRGWVLICASKVTYSDLEIRAISGHKMYGEIFTRLGYHLDNSIHDYVGKAIAIGKLTDCRHMLESDAEKCFVLFNRGTYCYVFEQVQRIEPFDWKGTQGWKILSDEEKQLIRVII